MTQRTIDIENARTHNLKGLRLKIPRNQLVVFTGVSGSGKSSLVFDTIYAEAQRRYMESLNTYGRQFMGQLDKAEVDSITGLSPAIAIDQKTASNTPRSTVGTVTEITDYLRVLYAKIGQPHCPDCAIPIEAQTQQQMLDTINSYPEGTKLQLLAPVVRGRKGDYNALFQQLRKEGYQRVRSDGEMLLLDELSEDYRLERYKLHTIEVVVDRLILKPADTVQQRLNRALEQALKKGDGLLTLLLELPDKNNVERTLSRHLACPSCDQNFPELAPRHFSFNSPYGACPTCQGTGLHFQLNWDACVPDPARSLAQDGFLPLKRLLGRSSKVFLKALAKTGQLDPNKAIGKWTANEKAYFLYGPTKKRDLSPSDTASMLDDSDELDVNAWLLADFEGVEKPLVKKWQSGSRGLLRQVLAPFFLEQECPACHGARLNPFSLAVTLGGNSIDALHQLSLSRLREAMLTLQETLEPTAQRIARQPLKEVLDRLSFLKDVGVNYLHLGRRAHTLSGGEAQRLRLASQLGSNLSGVMYVLDEPSIGLHPSNTEQLVATLKKLRDQQNTVLIVEHEEQIIRHADYLIDIGPKAGKDGGALVIAENAAEIVDKQVDTASLTWQYLSGKKQVEPRLPRRKPNGWLQLTGLTEHNLKNLTVKLPLGAITCVTGPSGSGKSTLVFDCLVPYITHLQDPVANPKPAGIKSVKGAEAIERLIAITQAPIGKSSRSNTATYTGVFDTIRKIFAATEGSKLQGLSHSSFSFNVKGGRCDYCLGEGVQSIQLGLLPKVDQVCSYCQGKRFKPDILTVLYNGRSICDVLEMPISEAADFFAEHPRLASQLQLLDAIGLGYLTLGQSTRTFSGGEAQRLKLATELLKKQSGKTLYVMDEPSIGLHWYDIAQLMTLLQELADKGNTILIIEHNLDIIRCADYVLDLGPEGGEAGGYLLAQGTPEAIQVSKHSVTGPYLTI